jgi:hypothetical protein
VEVTVMLIGPDQLERPAPAAKRPPRVPRPARTGALLLLAIIGVAVVVMIGLALLLPAEEEASRIDAVPADVVPEAQHDAVLDQAVRDRVATQHDAALEQAARDRIAGQHDSGVEQAIRAQGSTGPG